MKNSARALFEKRAEQLELIADSRDLEFVKEEIRFLVEKQLQFYDLWNHSHAKNKTKEIKWFIIFSSHGDDQVLTGSYLNCGLDAGDIRRRNSLREGAFVQVEFSK